MKLSKVRRFWLRRHEDVSGMSGTGVVAEGIIFSNGKVALSWLTPVSSLVIYDSITNVETIHGHEGRTEVVLEEDDDAPVGERTVR